MTTAGPVVVEPRDLAVFLGVDPDALDDDRAGVLLGLARDLCESITGDLPPAARAVVLGVAARAYTNPANLTGENAGGYSAQFGTAAGGMYLTRQDRAILRRLAGRGAAYTIDMTPADVLRRVPWWDRSEANVIGNL